MSCLQNSYPPAHTHEYMFTTKESRQWIIDIWLYIYWKGKGLCLSCVCRGCNFSHDPRKLEICSRRNSGFIRVNLCWVLEQLTDLLLFDEKQVSCCHRWSTHWSKARQESRLRPSVSNRQTMSDEQRLSVPLLLTPLLILSVISKENCLWQMKDKHQDSFVGPCIYTGLNSKCLSKYNLSIYMSL